MRCGGSILFLFDSINVVLHGLFWCHFDQDSERGKENLIDLEQLREEQLNNSGIIFMFFTDDLSLIYEGQKQLWNQTNSLLIKYKTYNMKFNTHKRKILTFASYQIHRIYR